MKKLRACLLFISLSFQNGWSQQLQLTNYSSEKSIPVYGINSIFQDSHGWMWFTSGHEVMRYDGYRFITYYPTANTVMDICYKVFEVNNEIWVEAEPYLLKVTGDSLQQLDIVNNTIDIVDHLEHKNESYFLSKNGIYKFKDHQLIPFITSETLDINSSESLAVYNDSLIVSHQFEMLLLVFNLKQKTHYTLPMPVTDIRKDKDGNILLLLKKTGITGLKKIKVMDDGLNIVTEPVYLFKDEKYEQFIIDGQGNFWTNEQFRKLVKFSTDKSISVFDESHGLPSLWFNQMFADREKNIWIGFNGGLCKISSAGWNRYTIGESLYSNHILFFTKHPGTRYVFVGTQNGLNIFDGNKIKQVRYLKQPFFCNTLISFGAIQYYTHDSILFLASIDPVTAEVKSIKKLAHLHASSVQLILDRAGNLFIATTKGIFVYAHQRLTRIVSDTNYFRSIMLDSHDRLWAGKFAEELHCYKIRYDFTMPRLEKLFQLDSILPSVPQLHAIRAIAESKGDFFIGTRHHGLFIFKLRNEQPVFIKHFGEKDGMASNSVWNFAFDSTGACWVANMKGLFLLKKQSDNWQLSNQGAKKHLYQASLVFSDTSNNIWVANHPGFVIIRKEEIPSEEPSAVSITGIVVNDRVIHPGVYKGNQFNYRNNNVRIEFTANTYRYEETVLYSWKLKDNDDWTIPLNIHSVNYSALEPGVYNFKVKALNAEGQWSSNEANFRFEILPPFWQQAWFMLLVVLVIAVMLYLLYRYRVKRLREMYEMRNIIARDLHDEIGSALTSINILSKVSQRNLEKDKNKADELLNKVIDQSQQVQQNMSDIVWAIKPGNDKLENMTVRMREYLSQTLEPKNISIEFIVDENIMQESFDMKQRRDFFLIFKEAVNNIAKYSQCRQTRIELTKKNGDISLLIQDDGIGFDKTKIFSSRGLANMQQRAELLKASFTLHSAPGEGTRVELLIPAT